MKKAIILMLALAGSAHAEFMDGNALLAQMKDTGSFFRQGHAMGYVSGIADMGLGVIHCAPSNMTAGQLNDMIRNYLENTPAERHLTGDTIVNKVLKTMWPCAKRGANL